MQGSQYRVKCGRSKTTSKWHKLNDTPECGQVTRWPIKVNRTDCDLPLSPEAAAGGSSAVSHKEAYAKAPRTPCEVCSGDRQGET